MANQERRIYGPPGTGKTTWCMDQIAKNQRIFGDREVAAVSFTRAAAVELAKRAPFLPSHNVGTVHAMCYRAMGQPELAVGAKLRTFHNDTGGDYTTDGVNVIDEGLMGDIKEDDVVSQYHLLRNKMTPRQYWPYDVRRFANVWEDWKVNNACADFTDLLEHCLNNVEYMPGRPKILFVDESQDLSRLQMAVVRKWSEHMEKIYIVGDDDQAIFTWAGGDPRVMLEPELPEEYNLVLNESYRVPLAVKEYAETIIKRVKQRKDKVYKPKQLDGKEVVGTLTHSDCSIGDSWGLLDEIRARLDSGKTVMVLASCAYMLRPLIRALREEGLPFHNPYRKSQGEWNPLRLGEGSTIERLLRFTGEYDDPDGRSFINNKYMLPWLEIMSARGVFKPRMKKEALRMWSDGDGEMNPDAFGRWLEQAAIDAFSMGDVDWFADNVETSRKGVLEYPLKLYKKDGVHVLTATPRVILGTIHSVKGGEADCVFVSPDLSRQAMDDLDEPEREDSLHRLFYVACTRAKEELVVLSQTNMMSYDLD